MNTQLRNNFFNIHIHFFPLDPREIQKEMASNKWDSRSILADSREFDAYSYRMESAWMEGVSPPAQPSSINYRGKTTPGTIMVIRNKANEQMDYFTRRLRAFSSNKLSIDEVLNISI